MQGVHPDGVRHRRSLLRRIVPTNCFRDQGLEMRLTEDRRRTPRLNLRELLTNPEEEQCPFVGAGGKAVLHSSKLHQELSGQSFAKLKDSKKNLGTSDGFRVARF